jgi:hypothetical protein
VSILLDEEAPRALIKTDPISSHSQNQGGSLLEVIPYLNRGDSCLNIDKTVPNVQNRASCISAEEVTQFQIITTILTRKEWEDGD